MKKTKIICTLGPASNNRETLKALMENGMDIARLTFLTETTRSRRAVWT